MKNVTVNISGQTKEDLLLAVDQIYQKLSEGFICGSDRNESGKYVFEVYTTQQDRAIGGISL